MFNVENESLNGIKSLKDFSPLFEIRKTTNKMFNTHLTFILPKKCFKTTCFKSWQLTSDNNFSGVFQLR